MAAGIFELAVELGKTLKADARLVKMEEARKAYEADERVARLVTEYEVQQKAMNEEAAKPDRSDEVIRLIQARIDALYTQIVDSETYKNLEKAQKEVNDLMNMVNSTITFQITGEEPSACTHNCSTCGGCH